MILAVRNADAVLSRAAESILSQDERDFELIIADCNSTDHTPRLIERLVERDIRVEALAGGFSSLEEAGNAAVEAARGTYILFIDQKDWLGTGYLAAQLRIARAHEAVLVYAGRTLEHVGPDGAARRDDLGVERALFADNASFRLGAASLVSRGVLLDARGALIDASWLRRQGACFDAAKMAGGFMTPLVRDASRVVVEPSAVYHASGCDLAAFDPSLYAICEARHAALMELARAWGMERDAAFMHAVHRNHLDEIIRCISNTAVAGGRISSIERRQRVQDMIDARATCASVEAMRDRSRDFGLMFSPIARRSAAACCMGARLQDVVDRVLVPFTPAG